ncbi:MAG TPA: hypothetical protein VK081_12765, partial [Planctomycetota bacterium]|nr:hypothetical protein [Planctomycetota bacterium]
MLARSKLVPFLLALVPCAAQPPATFPAPPEILAHYALRDGTVQNLVLPWQASGPFSVRVVLDGVERTLALVPHDVRARDFVLFVDDGNGLHAQPTPASVTFRGEVAGLDGSAVAASLIDGQLQAIVLLPDGTQWAVQPLTEVHAALPRASHVVYRGTDVVLPDDLRCGAGGRPVEVQGGGGVGIAALKVCEIAVDADLAYYARYGNNATT